MTISRGIIKVWKMLIEGAPLSDVGRVHRQSRLVDCSTSTRALRDQALITSAER